MSIQYVNTLIPYFESDSLTKDYTFRDGLKIEQEDKDDFILPDTIHRIAFKYRDVTVFLRIATDGLTLSRYVYNEFTNMGLRSETTGWIFYDGSRHERGCTDIHRIHDDVSYRCYFVDYILSHVNAMLK